MTHSLTAEGHDASEDGTGRGTPIVFVKGRRAGENDNSPESWRAGNVSPTLDANGQGPRTATAVVSLAVAGDFSSSENVAQTVRAAHGQPGVVGHDTVVRRLTPMECERLQGFPDNWTAGQKDSPRYKQMGNSLAIPVVEWIAHRLVAIDGGKS